MGSLTGFMDEKRKGVPYTDPLKRLKSFEEFKKKLNDKERQVQGSRCMDCGVPFCQSDYGCPVKNLIPEWNDLIYRGKWEEAFHSLMSTNNFPEYTGRVCPAPCEHACVLGINEPAVTIKDNECAIIDRAYDAGLMVPRPPLQRSGKKVAIIGSGPAGLAAADQLNKAGHRVTIYERDDRIGGLLMYGIPNMKLDKQVVERRNKLMEEEGVQFITNAHVGVNVDAQDILAEHDAMLLAIGSTRPRDLQIPSRDLEGIHFAMEFLKANTKSLLDSGHDDGKFISAKGKDVVVIGGGDTGNDCLGTAMRHECKSILNLELLSKPLDVRDASNPWPLFAKLYKLDYGHEEASSVFGADPREYATLTEEFIGREGVLKGLKTVKVRWKKEPGSPPKIEKIAGTEKEFPADLVFISLGFLGPEESLLRQLSLKTTTRGTIDAPQFQTSVKKIFTAGDARRGQSLVVWGIREGRDAANEIDNYLMNS